MDSLTETLADFGRTLAAQPLVKAIGAALVFLVNEAFGGLPARPLATLAILVGLDTALGFAYAVVTRSVESPRLVRGVVKLMVYFGTLLILNLLAKAGLDAAWEAVVRAVVVLAIGYMLTTEGVSVLEHVAAWADHFKMDLPVLGQVLGILRVRRDALARRAQGLAQPPKP